MIKRVDESRPFCYIILRTTINKETTMNDYVAQLKEIKKNMRPRQHLQWTENDVRELLRTGKSENHGEGSCRTTLAELRRGTGRTFNRFSHIVHEYEQKTGIKVKLTHTKVKSKESNTEAVPVVTETVKHEPTVDELTLNIKAAKALLEGRLSFTQIAKIMNKEENLVISLLKVAEAFKI